MDNLIVLKTRQGKRWVERRTGLLFGTYHWRGGPRFFVAVGRTERTNTIFEIGVLGRTFYLAPEPD